MDENFWLQDGLNLLCRVCPSDQCSKRHALISADRFERFAVFGNCDFLENFKL